MVDVAGTQRMSFTQPMLGTRRRGRGLGRAAADGMLRRRYCPWSTPYPARVRAHDGQPL